jgi:heptosyltransferase III
LNRILVIRGGAIGDFVLTLPALKALRDAHPQAEIEILGYKHIAAIADQRFYANAVRSIEYGAFSRFFARNAELDVELRDYFAGFDLIVSYLYDPDEIFENNLRRSGARKIARGPAKIGNDSHATRQLAAAMAELDINVTDFAPKIFPSAEDRQFAREFLKGCGKPIFAIHPGSGSVRKNWPLQNWIDLTIELSGSLIIVSGEADEIQTAHLQVALQDRQARWARNLPLPQLAAVLEQTTFIGHDSGISQLAGAAGAHCILLFGPTDPRVWAPLNENVQILRAPSGRMEDIELASVLESLARLKER